MYKYNWTKPTVTYIHTYIVELQHRIKFIIHVKLRVMLLTETFCCLRHAAAAVKACTDNILCQDKRVFRPDLGAYLGPKRFHPVNTAADFLPYTIFIELLC